MRGVGGGSLTVQSEVNAALVTAHRWL